MFSLYFSIIITLAHLPLYSTENKLRTEIGSYAKSNLFRVYHEKNLDDTEKSWNVIKEYHEKNRIDFNVPMVYKAEDNWTQDIEYSSPLHYAIQWSRPFLINKLLDEKTVKIRPEDFALHAMARFKYHCSKTELYSNIIPIIIKKLINKGCSVNSINHFKQTPLEVLYYDGRHDSIWKCPSPTLFIENGAQLMVKDGQRTWNILRQCCKLYKMQPEEELQLFFVTRSTNEKFFIHLPIMTDALFNKFKYDYKTYCKAFVTMMLLSKRLKSEKNIFIPKVISHYIANFLDPIEHIENTLQDRWNENPWYAHRFARIESQDESCLEVNAIYDELIKLITPGVWAHAWKEYKQGERKESNLIMRALAYNSTD